MKREDLVAGVTPPLGDRVESAGPPVAHLFVQSGPNSGEVCALEAAPVVVGRGHDCDLVLRDPFVSRSHFRIERRRDAVPFLVDLGSRNCTVVNGLPAREKALVHGDEIRIGSSRILFVVSRVGRRRRAEGEVTPAITSLLAGPGEPTEIVGGAPSMGKVFEMIARAAPLDSTVLVTGESGTGKELVARALHRQSPRREGPLVTLNCAAIPRDLVESELFGHEKGAFSGAHALRLGKFELASGGTLFLDEVGDLPSEGQAKLLRVLEERKVARLGGQKEIAVDVRIVAATNRDLRRMAQGGSFRLDLLYRLEVVTIALPSLRERKEDIPLLARHFLDGFREKLGRGELHLAPAAVERLCAHPWPGNVRELRNVIERVAIFSAGGAIGAADLGLPGDAPPPAAAVASLAVAGAAAREPVAGTPAPGVVPIDAAIREQVERALAASGGNRTKAASLLGIPRTTLYVYLDRFGLRRPGPRPPA